MIRKEEERRLETILTWNLLERKNRSQINRMIKNRIMGLIKLKENLMKNLQTKKKAIGNSEKTKRERRS